MLEIDILFNLSIKDCMFLTSLTKNFEEYSTTKKHGEITIGILETT
jgi:hypothetical protein